MADEHELDEAMIDKLGTFLADSVTNFVRAHNLTDTAVILSALETFAASIIVQNRCCHRCTLQAAHAFVANVLGDVADGMFEVESEVDGDANDLADMEVSGDG